MAIEIVDLPINSMLIFHSYVNVYQRVSKLKIYPAQICTNINIIWVNENISLTWIVRPAMGMIFLMNIPGFGRTGFGRDEIYPNIWVQQTIHLATGQTVEPWLVNTLNINGLCTFVYTMWQCFATQSSGVFGIDMFWHKALIVNHNVVLQNLSWIMANLL